MQKEVVGSGLRNYLDKIVSSKVTEKVIITLLLINAVTLGMETSPVIMQYAGTYIHILDKAILAVFVIEIAARLIAKGLSFFRSGWNIFDFLIITLALIPSTGQFQVLRSLRVLRVLRLASTIPSMRRVVNGLIAAIPGMGSITLLLLMIFYIFSVIATNLYGETFPQFFGTIGSSLYSLFQIMTLEGWSEGVVRPIMKIHPYAWTFFVPFILLTSFTVLNLFIGIIVSSMQQDYEDTAQKERDAIHEDSQEAINEVKQLKTEIALLREKLEQVVPQIKQ